MKLVSELNNFKEHLVKEISISECKIKDIESDIDLYVFENNLGHSMQTFEDIMKSKVSIGIKYELMNKMILYHSELENLKSLENSLKVILS